MEGLDALSTDERVARYAEAAKMHGEAPLIVDVLEGGASVQVNVTLGAQTLQATIVTG